MHTGTWVRGCTKGWVVPRPWCDHVSWRESHPKKIKQPLRSLLTRSARPVAFNNMFRMKLSRAERQLCLNTTYLRLSHLPESRVRTDLPWRQEINKWELSLFPSF